MIKQQLSTIVRKFLNDFEGVDTAHKLVLAACTLELFRQAQTPEKRPSFFRALSEFAKNAHDVNWGAVPFSFTKYALTDGRRVAAEYGADPAQIDDILIEALAVFSDLICDGFADSDVKPEALFDAVIAELTEAKKTQTVKTKFNAPEIYAERMLSRVFKPVEFTDDVAKKSGASLVTFKDSLPNGEPGPSLRGIAFDNGTNQWLVLLETGEFVRRAKGDEAITATNTAEDYAAVCPALLLFVYVAAKELHTWAILDDEQYDFISKQAGFGSLLKPHCAIVAKQEMVASLENVIDSATEAVNLGLIGATGPHGASVRFAVPETDFVIVLDAMTSSTGPYVVSRLMQHERVLMRLEHPRQFSARGVYLFPLAGHAVSLTVLH
jgi:hypothetical protein